MKYVITEQQYTTLIENYPNWIKRRLNRENFKSHITSAIKSLPDDYSSFGDEFEFADNILSWATDDFMTIDENMVNDENYSDYYDLVFEWAKDEFGEGLLSFYYDNENK